jgi:hypothetical protein
MQADEGVGAQGQRNVRGRVADQFPRDRCRRADIRGDFHPRVVQLAAQRGPLIVGLKEVAEQLDPDLGHAALDGLRDGRGRVVGVQ